MTRRTCNPDWSRMLVEIIDQIATRLEVVQDFKAFRGVCTTWRAAVKEDRYVHEKLFGKLPVLLLAEVDGENDERELYSLVEKKVAGKIKLPEAKGKRCFNVGFSWILTYAPSGGEVVMLKPLSRQRPIQLPNIKSFPGYGFFVPADESRYIERAALSADPSTTNTFALRIAINFNIGYWKNGDDGWIRTNTFEQELSICRYNRVMYSLDLAGCVWVINSAEPKSRLDMIVKIDLSRDMASVYIVESTASELLLIRRISEYGSTSHFQVFQVDIPQKQLQERKELNGDAIFLGDNAPFSIAAAEYPGLLKPDCIYFTDDSLDDNEWATKKCGEDMGIYNIQLPKDQAIERFEVESRSFLCTPLWICFAE